MYLHVMHVQMKDLAKNTTYIDEENFMLRL